MEWELKEIDKYVVVNKAIGKGTQAVVYEAYKKDNLQQVAAKVFDLSQPGSNNQSRNLNRLVQIQTTLKHPYILECYDYKKTQKNAYFFLEYCDGGDLEKYLKEKGFISESECLDFFKQIVSAFQMLEKKNIVHRDLKPANILIKNGQLKIADFGFAKEIQDDVKNTIVGSPIFMCPQAFDGTGRYDLKKGDVWSAGVCLYLMLYGNYPFYATNIQNLIQTLTQQQLVFRDDLFKRSDPVKDLLSHMLDKDEAKRYTWDQVANHKCLKAGSQYQNNPLLGSLEMNQVSGISSFNSDYKNVELKHHNESKITTEEQPMTIQTQQNQSNVSIYNRRDNVGQLKQIHCIVRLQSQFAMVYRVIWKGFLQLIQTQQQDLVYFKSESIMNAIFLLINSLLLKENKFLRDLKENAKQCIMFRIQHHNIQNILEEDLNSYLNSEIYKSFYANLEYTYTTDTLVSLKNFKDLLQAHLIAAGFKQSMAEENCNQFIECSLGIINKQIKEMAQEAYNLENKTYIILLLYLFFLQNKEKKLQSFTNPLEHYQKLIKEMESINFMSKQQIFQLLLQYIQTDITNYEGMDDEDEDDEEENEQQFELCNKFT